MQSTLIGARLNRNDGSAVFTLLDTKLNLQAAVVFSRGMVKHLDMARLREQLDNAIVNASSLTDADRTLYANMPPDYSKILHPQKRHEAHPGQN
jgi:hypothetical protein